MIIITIPIIIIGCIIIGIYLNDDNCCMCGNVENNCCPCPNNEWFNIVEEWAGYEASGAGSWLYMCEEYQKVNNITFDCFK